MCGIAGKIDFSGASVPESVILRMCTPIVHRGPDAGGTHSAPYIGLGERRLSIIDLAESANPPLRNEDATIWIVFNGEIYNFRELRATLISEGHRFRTQGDTEVILHLYEKHGVRCIEHLRECSHSEFGTPRNDCSSEHAIGWGKSRLFTARRRMHFYLVRRLMLSGQIRIQLVAEF